MSPISSSPPPSSYVILGAGIFGTSTALHLIRAYPNASIILIDRDPYDEEYIPAPSATKATPFPSPFSSSTTRTSWYSNIALQAAKPHGTRVAASWDWNKVIRADYADPIYCRLALEAQDKWRHDELWREWYHETGIFWISRTGIADKVVENFEALGVGGKGKRTGGDDVCLPETVSVDEAKRLYGGIFDEADYSGIEKVLVNRTSGWADAKGALRAATREAVRLGVKYAVAEVEELVFESRDDDDDGGGGGRSGLICTGVRTSNGDIISAEHVVLCTGAYTPRLLEQSAEQTGCNELRAGERIIAAAVTTGIAQLDEQDAERFRGMPVCCQENPPERGASNGTLPINADNQIKWWGQRIFKNTISLPRLKFDMPLPRSGVELSMPPPEPDYAEWSVPPALQDDIKFANKVTFGSKGKDWDVGQFRICWEALTPSHDFIISPHSTTSPSTATGKTGGGLYIATCGSFHGWKFFPIIGDYVLQMLEGRLDPELVQKWAWDREIKRVPDDREWPRIELKDLWQEEVKMKTTVRA